VPNGSRIETSSNLRFADFPSDYTKLPTVAFVIPNLNHDMHNGTPKNRIPTGDAWLRQNLDRYYQWAKNNNSLLIVTFDENHDKSGRTGLTDPAVIPDNQLHHDLQNRIVRDIVGTRQSAIAILAASKIAPTWLCLVDYPVLSSRATILFSFSINANQRQ